MDDQDKEELRHAVLTVLYARHPAALNRKMILNRVAMEVDFDVALPDVVAALEVLTGLGYAAKTVDELGSGEYWACSSGGVLAWERSKRANKPRHD